MGTFAMKNVVHGIVYLVFGSLLGCIFFAITLIHDRSFKEKIETSVMHELHNGLGCDISGKLSSVKSFAWAFIFQ